MNAFTYKNGELHAEGVALSAVAADVVTPVYVYSVAAMTDAYRRFIEALSGQRAQVCYAMKANSNLAVIRTFAELGAGADVVSDGELERALAAGIPGKRIVYSGVGKTREEMAAGIDAGILQFNVESLPELAALSEVAVGKQALRSTSQFGSILTSTRRPTTKSPRGAKRTNSASISHKLPPPLHRPTLCRA
jgi:diaminopimelate decarboxylase